MFIIFPNLIWEVLGFLSNVCFNSPLTFVHEGMEIVFSILKKSRAMLGMVKITERCIKQPMEN